MIWYPSLLNQCKTLNLASRTYLHIFWSAVKLFLRTYICIYIYLTALAGCNTRSILSEVGRRFANGPGDLGSIPGRIIPKTLKWYLIPPCFTLSNIRYVSRVKGSNPENGVAPILTPRFSSYWKGSLRVALYYSHQQTIDVHTGFSFS